MRFADIPTHASIKKQIHYSIQHNQVPHAQLFWGPAGSAQLSVALAFATYLHCENRLVDDACGQCASCLKMHNLVHPDVKFVFPISATKQIPGKEVGSNSYLKAWRTFVKEQPYGLLRDWSYQIGSEQKQLTIPKEEARQIIQYVNIKPLAGAYKIILIWLPEYFHPYAANALLKVLEEPAPRTIFLLVSMDPEKLLNTIRSRTQQIYVPAFTDAALTQLLTAHYPLQQEKIAQVVPLANGNWQQALKLIADGQEDVFELFVAWMRLCYANHFTKLVAQADLFQQLGKEGQRYFLSYALYMCREALVIAFNQPNQPSLSRATAVEQDFVAKLRKNLSDQQIKNFSEWLNQAYYYIERNINPKILWLNLSLKIAQAFQKPAQK